MTTKEIVFLAAKIADDKKAENVTLIDLKGLSSLCDYVLICTATSKPHLEAVEQEVSTELKQYGIYKSNRDGGESGLWRVSDYGSFMFHIMTQEMRDFYALEKIFSFGDTIDWQKKEEPKKKPAVKKAAPKKPAVKKAPAKKATAKKPEAKKAAVKKAPAKKAAPKKAAPKKAVKKTIKKTTTAKKK